HRRDARRLRLDRRRREGGAGARHRRRVQAAQRGRCDGVQGRRRDPAARSPPREPLKHAERQGLHLMNFTDVFIRRPVLAIVVNLVIIIAGLQAIRTLNVRQYPKLESATVTVRTAYVGASSDLVRGFITTPPERAIAAADGIDFIESQSVQGLSTINVRLKLNFSAANALSDISARVNQVRADLPPEAEIPAINIEPSDAQVAA